MRADPSCPRCGLVPAPARALVQRVELPTSTARCRRCSRPSSPRPSVLRAAATGARVPVWLPWPLPRGWLVTGRGARRRRAHRRPGHRGGLLRPRPAGRRRPSSSLVAEEPGVGLGARFAGLDGPDAGVVPDRAVDAKIHAAGHPTAMWSLGRTGRRATAPSTSARRSAAGSGRSCGRRPPGSCSSTTSS